MKKIISMFAIMFMMAITMSAQTVERYGVFSNMYIGLKGGATYAPINELRPFNTDKIGYVAGLEVGKNITPVTGISLVGYVTPSFNDGFKVANTNLNANVKFNLMNLFGKYKGQPRVFEILTVTGIGWDHNFGTTNPNDISLNGGLEFNFNLGKERAWYITLSPQVYAHNIVRTSQDIEPMIKHAALQTTLGVTYRFKNRNGSHNMTLCPYTRTNEEYNELYTEYENVKNKAMEVDTVVVEKVVEVEKPVEIGYVTECITFDKNSDVIKSTEMQRLDLYMHTMSKDITYVVCGSADTGTGSYGYNSELAQKRADAVVKVLKENGFNAETVVKLDALDVTELSRCAIITKK